MQRERRRTAPGTAALIGGVAVALALTLSSACAAEAGTGAAAAGPSAPVQAPVQTAPPVAPPTPSEVTVPGVIRRGVGPGCWVLSADDGRHFVVADVPNPTTDVAVVVHGEVDPTEASFCNAGAVLHAQSITPR